MKVKVDVLGSPSLIILTVSMLVKQHFKKDYSVYVHRSEVAY